MLINRHRLAQNMSQDTQSERKLRHRKLSEKDRIAITELYGLGIHTMTEIAEMFNVSQPRISQIVNDSYGEMKQIYTKSEE